MSKQIFKILLLILLLSALLLTGCAESKTPANNVETDNAAAGTEPVTVEETEPAAETGIEESTVSFGQDDTVEHDGLCRMSGLYAEVLDDAAVAEGWYYYYTDTDKSPAEVIVWKPSGENYTTAEVLFTVENISGKPQTFGDKISARLLYQENDAAAAECFEGTVFQQNPGQVEESGEIIMWSTKPAEIAAGESANVSFRFDIPKDVYDGIYATATGENSGIKEVCEFSFGGGTKYEVNLAELLIPASQY